MSSEILMEGRFCRSFSGSTAEDLLAGLLLQHKETGLVGQQLVYILLGAGITPAPARHHSLCYSPIPRRFH